jgi:cell division protein FtsB
MRLVTLAVALLLVLIQYPLWLGDGGWLKVWDKERKLAESQRHNDELRMRNAALDAEVRDLRDGTSAMEERARLELGMIHSDELFVQILEPGKAGNAAAAPNTGAAPNVAAAAPAVQSVAPASTALPAAQPVAQAAATPAAHRNTHTRHPAHRSAR